MLNDERKRNERRFQKLLSENKSTLEEAGGIKAVKKAPHSNGDTREKSKARGGVWIMGDLLHWRDRAPEKGSSAPLDSSGSDEVSAKNHDRVQTLDGSTDAQDDDSSLLDMESFLKSTDPGSPRTSGDHTSTKPGKHYVFRSRDEAGDPTAKGNTFDLIKFFREASPWVIKRGNSRTPRSVVPPPRTTGPVTPPLTVPDHSENSRPFLPPDSSSKTHIHSDSAALASPLASHPPQPRAEAARPATARWPLQAVLSWLEQNSFSAEWQETFRVLGIEGPGFVELESGQSIRKMLTVIYPQLAKQCFQSGKGWDQARERAEGQRLRKLLRELPVDMKHHAGPLTTRPVMGSDGTQTIRSLPRRENSSGARRRAVTSPTADTSTKLWHTRAPKPSKRTDVVTPQASEEGQQLNVATEPQLRGISDQPHGNGNPEPDPAVHDEWVKKWTVLSPEQIARGRKPASSTWLID